MHSFDFNIRIIDIKVGGFSIVSVPMFFFISLIFNTIKLKIIASRWGLEVSKSDFIGSFHTMCDISTNHLQSVSKINMKVTRYAVPSHKSYNKCDCSKTTGYK